MSPLPDQKGLQPTAERIKTIEKARRPNKAVFERIIVSFENLS
jgi:hypothetical protein